MWIRLPLLLIIIMAGSASVVKAQDDPAATKQETTTEAERPFADFEEKFSERQKMLMEDFQVWYEKTREASEKGKDWVVKDIQNIGDWEYLIVTISASGEEELSQKLNAYGQDRWEVIWVQKKIQGVQFYMKRRVRTYIKHIPVGDLLHMVPSNQQQ